MERRLLCIALLLAASFAHAQQAYVPVEKRLSADEMRDTGLDQLSPAQLALLNRLLESDRARAVSAARDEAETATRRAERLPVESRIKGAFRGWRVGDVLVLENGQRWRVTEGDLNIRPIQSPKASIRPGLISGWYLRVEGQVPMAKVSRAD